MARRSTVRRVEEFILFDVLYEDGTGTHVPMEATVDCRPGRPDWMPITP
jgi:hypothetical protein